jgi:ABC-type branched-subunit amino acid transport system ATPase component
MNGVTRDASHPTILTATDIVAGYDDLTILHGVTATVKRGELVVVIGPNGAGKSTLLKVISGLLPCRAGRIDWAGTDRSPARDLTKRPASQRASVGMGVVPQVDNVFANMSVLENLKIGGFLKRRDIEPALATVFEEFPLLYERRKQRAGTLSGGQRKMLALARALIAEPSLLLLDEPSAALSPAATDELMEKLVDLRSRGVSMLLVEQNARRALAMCDYAFVLDMGRNRFEGTGQSLLEDDKVVRLYLGERPSTRSGRRDESNET